MPLYSALGEEIRYPIVPNCCHGNTSGRRLPIVTVVIQLQTQKGRAARLVYKNVNSLLLEERQWKMNIQGQKIIYPRRMWRPPEPDPLLHAGSFLPQLSGSLGLYWKLSLSHWRRSAPLYTRGKKLQKTEDLLVNRELWLWSTDFSKSRHPPSLLISIKHPQRDLHIYVCTSAPAAICIQMCIGTQRLYRCSKLVSFPEWYLGFPHGNKTHSRKCMLMVETDWPQHSGVCGTCTVLLSPFLEGYRDLPKRCIKTSNSYIFIYTPVSGQSQWPSQEHYISLPEFS